MNLSLHTIVYKLSIKIRGEIFISDCKPFFASILFVINFENRRIEELVLEILFYSKSSGCNHFDAAQIESIANIFLFSRKNISLYHLPRFFYNNYKKKKNLHIFLNKFHPRLLLEISRKSRLISRSAIWTHCILAVKTDKIRREPFENDSDFSTIVIERN